MPRLSKGRKELLTTMMRDSIFEATTSVMCEHGVDGTTMNRVAETADLAKSSLYDYFPSKDELLEFVSDRLQAPFMRAVEETVQADLPAPRKLETIARMALETGIKHKAIVKLVVQSDQQYRAREKTRPRILEAFTAIFEQGIREGSFHPHNPTHAGRMFLGVFHEIFELLASSASEQAANDYVGVMLDAVLHGVSIRVQNGENKA